MISMYSKVKGDCFFKFDNQIFNQSSYKKIPKLYELIRTELQPKDYAIDCWTPVGPRTERLLKFREVAINNLSTPILIDSSFQIDKHITMLDNCKFYDVIKKIQNEEMLEDSGEENGIKFLTHRVFQFAEIPELIFKVAFEKEKIHTLKERVEKISIFQKVIKERKLTHLKLPQGRFLSKIGENISNVVIEEKLELAEFDFTRQNELWKFCLRESSLKQLMTTIITQLTELICDKNTELYDIRADNIPLLAGGKGIGLVDIELTGCPHTGVTQLLNIITPEFFSIVEKIAEKNLSETTFSKINFKTIKRERILQLKCKRQTKPISSTPLI
jgi:hypothetical protein